MGKITYNLKDVVPGNSNEKLFITIVFQKEYSSNTYKIPFIGKMLFKCREDLKERIKKEVFDNRTISFKDKHYYFKDVSCVRVDSEEILYILNYDRN